MLDFLKHNKILLKKFFIFSIFLAVSFFAAAQSPDLSGQLDADDFLEFALVASGVDDEKFAPLFEKMTGVADEFLEKAKTFESEGEIAEKGLLFLYEKILKMYQATQTLLDVAIENGRYNCVSSSVMYMYLMKRCGIKCIGNETPLHAFCTIAIDGKKIDVETTNPYGFNPGEKKQVSDKRYYVVPAKNYKNRIEIGERRLLSLIYNNRVVELQKKRKPDEMFPLALAAEELQLKSPESTEFVYSTAINAIADYTALKRYDDALKFAREFLEERDGDKRITQNIDAACSEVIRNFEKKGDYNGAFDFLSDNKDIISSENYAEFEYTLTHNFLATCAKTEPFEVAVERIEERKNFLTEAHFINLINFCYNKEAERISKKEGNHKAFLFAFEAAEKYPEVKGIQQLLSVTRQNYAIDIHNKIVPLMNSGRHEEAMAIVMEAIAEIGSVRILENDLARMK